MLRQRLRVVLQFRCLICLSIIRCAQLGGMLLHSLGLRAQVGMQRLVVLACAASKADGTSMLYYAYM